MQIVIRCKNDQEKQAAISYLSAISGRETFRERKPSDSKAIDTFGYYPYAAVDLFNTHVLVQGCNDRMIRKEDVVLDFKKISDCALYFDTVDVKLGDTVFHKVSHEKVRRIQEILNEKGV
jgi:hypothetical protein